jgi:DUF1365 family protein
MPAQGIRVLAGIHWEAFRLWCKGLKLLPEPARPDSPISIQKKPAAALS